VDRGGDLLVMRACGSERSIRAPIRRVRDGSPPQLTQDVALAGVQKLYGVGCDYHTYG